MGSLDSKEPVRIRVRVDLRSGETMNFEIDEYTFGYCKALLDSGLEGRELWNALLGSAAALDPPTAIHASGTLSDGRGVELSIPATAAGRRRATPRGGGRL